jgi:nicotinate-nucleotide pyrophosphorylase (carboxylating)
VGVTASSNRLLPAPEALEQLAREALAEDVGSGDVTSEGVVGEAATARAAILVKRPGVVCGLDAAAAVFRAVDPDVSFEALAADGDRIDDVPADVAHIEGPARALLTGERTALNLLGRLSGIATLTRRYVDAVGGTGAEILDTRKTTPGLRGLEKHAVRCGGGRNHRFGLDDGILIKDNHIRLAGGLAEAVRRMKAANQEMPIEIEAQSLDQVDEAIQSGADIILLDNLTIDQVKDALARIAGRAKVEISGGVTLERIPELARTGADYVSVGALTHSAPAADLSFELEPDA